MQSSLFSPSFFLMSVALHVSILSWTVNTYFSWNRLLFSSPLLVLNSKEFTEDIDSIWDFEQSIQQYTSTGGTSKQSVIQQIQSLRNWMQEKTLLWSILTPERKERRVTSTVTLVQTTTSKYRKTRSTSITRVSESKWKNRLVSFSFFSPWSSSIFRSQTKWPKDEGDIRHLHCLLLLFLMKRSGGKMPIYPETSYKVFFNRWHCLSL